MVFPILGSGDSSSGYNIENSCRFSGDTYLRIDSGEDASTRSIFTLSFWIKRGTLSGDSYSNEYLFTSNDVGGSNHVKIYFNSNQQLTLELKVSGSTTTMVTTRRYQDRSAWYHIVIAVDSTLNTSGDRVKFYTNGVRDTAFGTEQYPAEDATFEWFNNTEVMTIGARTAGDRYFDGYMSEIAIINITAGLTASDFGETDEDSGIWKPKKITTSFSPTNSCYLEFKQTGTGQNSSGIGADTGGNDKHWAVTNLTATDQCTDTPTNNFATLRIARDPAVSGAVLTEGNLKFVTGTSGSGRALGRSVYGTIPVNKGKWYFETKILIANIFVGVAPDEGANVAASTGDNPRFVAYYPIGNGTIGQIYTKLQTTETQPTYGDQSSANDILGIAVDMDNKLMYVRNSGGWADDSGNWDEANPNESTSINFDNDDTHLPGYVVPWMSSSGGGTSSSVQWNFGSPPFAISSSNADANGYGNFEYAVPSGYYAMCTKNLAEYG